ARSTVPSFPLADFQYPQLAQYLKENSGDYRTLNLVNPDSAMILRNENIWGYDPTVLKRYAQLLHFSQGNDPEKAGQYLAFSRPHPVLALLRGRLAFLPRANGEVEVRELGNAAPRFLVVSKYRVVPDRRAVFAALNETGFDFGSEVVLEK